MLRLLSAILVACSFAAWARHGAAQVASIANAHDTYALTDQAKNDSGVASAPATVDTWADGSRGVICADPAQFPKALDGYKLRPSWKVPGVDYFVGLCSAVILKDPTTSILPAGATWDSANRLVRVDSAETVTLDGYDFSVGVGVGIYLTSGSLIIQNSKIQTQNFTYPVQVAAGAANLTIRNSLIDGGMCGRTDVGGKSIAQVGYAGSGIVTFEYNMWQYLVEDGLDTTTGNNANVTLNAKYNLYYIYGTRSSGHADPIQFNGDYSTAGTANGGTQSFNFIWEPHGDDSGAPYNCEAAILAGNTPEGIQRQAQGGISITNYTISENVIIADAPHNASRGYTSGQISYAIQIEQTCCTNSGGVIMNNYIDAQGMYGPIYPGTGSGITCAGNKDMRSGASIMGIYGTLVCH